MENSKTPPPRRVLTPIIAYIACGVTALVLFVTSLVSWLSRHVCSGACAALMVGGAFLVLSLIIYVVSARRSIEHLKEHIETIYDVALTARTGYRKVMDFLNWLLG